MTIKTYPNPKRMYCQVTFEYLAKKLGILDSGDSHITVLEPDYSNNTLKIYFEKDSKSRVEGESAELCFPEDYWFPNDK